MNSTSLKIYARPLLTAPQLVMGFSGWMDGGDVSIGCIETLCEKLNAKRLAKIKPDEFYIYNFPGTMEVSAIFRPFVDINDGHITEYEEPKSLFYYAEQANLILLSGKEPNLGWPQYAECVLEIAEMFNVRQMFFVGSVAGLVPHTRDPRFSSVLSNGDEATKKELLELGVRLSNYDGPASIVTYLTLLAEKKKIPMASLIAEIPAYVQGRNIRAIQAVLRRLCKLLKLEPDLDLEEMRILSDELERRIDKAVQERPELAEHIGSLEENYDKAVFDNEMGDLKNWLEQQGIRLD